MFELAFRLLKADEVINFMEKNQFLSIRLIHGLSFFGYIIIHRRYYYQQRGIFLKIKKRCCNVLFIFFF